MFATIEVSWSSKVSLLLNICQAEAALGGGKWDNHPMHSALGGRGEGSDKEILSPF